MTTVTEHISDLLYTHECVIIPNFGAFVTTPVSSRLDTDKNIFLPPSVEIGFNRSLSHNDGLLISTLAQKNKTDYSIAKKAVEKFVTDTMGKIQHGERVSIDKIGTLKQDAIGLIQFIADKSENYLTDSYGLDSFHFAPIVNIKQHKPVNIQVRKLLRPVTHKHIAASVALLVGLFALSPDISNSSVYKDINSASTLSFMSFGETEVEKQELSDNNTFYLQPEKENTKASTPQIPESVSGNIESAPVTEKNIYFLIAGSFAKESQAKQYISRIKSKSEENAFIIASGNNRYRVAVAGYSDKADALNELNNYRSRKGFEGVWVLRQR